MLVIRRRIGEKLYIGDNIEIEVIEAAGGRVRLGVTAPREVLVVRGEARLTRQQNSKAASLTPEQISGLLRRVQESASLNESDNSPHTEARCVEEEFKAAPDSRQEA